MPPKYLIVMSMILSTYSLFRSQLLFTMSRAKKRKARKRKIKVKRRPLLKLLKVSLAGTCKLDKKVWHPH